MLMKFKRFLVPMAEHLFHWLGHFITRYCHQSLGISCGSCTREHIGDVCNTCEYFNVCECRGDFRE